MVSGTKHEECSSLGGVITNHELLQRLFKKLVVNAHTAGVLYRRQGVLNDYNEAEVSESWSRRAVPKS
jgi:hypothetical protein